MSERQKQHHGRSEGDNGEKIPGRDFENANYASTQHEQTETRNDVVRRQGEALDEAGEPARDDE